MQPRAREIGLNRGGEIVNAFDDWVAEEKELSASAQVDAHESTESSSAITPGPARWIRTIHRAPDGLAQSTSDTVNGMPCLMRFSNLHSAGIPVSGSRFEEHDRCFLVARCSDQGVGCF